jgi:hypothetical protein
LKILRVPEVLIAHLGVSALQQTTSELYRHFTGWASGIIGSHALPKHPQKAVTASERSSHCGR